MRRTPVRSVDGYLAALPADQRAALERLRKTLHVVIPRARECISYGLPALRLDGTVLVWFGASAKHCAFYPGGVVDEFADELEPYGTSKGTVRFQPDTPLPVALIRKLVKARLARTAARSRRTRAGPGAAERRHG
jgi:uncharacterized protein YdhG (YjbR/CyaY superfamily)